MNAILIITEPNGRSWEMGLVPEHTYAIGRSKENDIVLNDRRVSRKHAYIDSARGDYRMIDGYFENGELLRSINRVFVNGTPQLEKTLETGDVIMIGESSIEFKKLVPATKDPEVKTEMPALAFTIDAAGVVVPQAIPDTIIPDRSPPQSIAPVVVTAEEVVPESVSYDDAPLGHTQVQMSANEIIGRQSHLSMESAAVSAEEIKVLRRKARMLELLFEMSRTLGTVFDLKEIFEKATDLIFRGTPADRVVALLANETPDGRVVDYSLRQVGARTREAEFEKLSEKLTISRTITQKVIREKVALLSQDAKTDEQFFGAESIVTQGVRSTICAPLITESNVHGVLYADRLDPFAAFSADDLELISAVAAQTAVTVETVRAHTRLAREEVARANYSRFMPEYVVKQLLENPDSFRLGGANQTVTVLFADIRGFTLLSEKENPEKVVGLLNRYFTAMTEIIFAHGGTLDKYIGDGLMAIFGAPTTTPVDATNAVKAAVAMQKRLLTLNHELATAGYPAVQAGIGLHTGEATIGYVGSEQRSEYTAIGDTVNLAARLESNAAGGQILISDATLTAAGNIFPVAAREPLMVRNRLQPVDLYEVKWA